MSWYFIELYGVRIVSMREDRARVVTKLLPNGTWALLPNGCVGIKKSHYNRLRYNTGHTKTLLDVAEAFHKLGVMPKDKYKKIVADLGKKLDDKLTSDAVEELLHYARQAGIALTKTQLRKIEKRRCTERMK